MSYSILFSVECLHGYFGGGPCRSLSLHPDEGCKALLGRYRLLFRSAPGGCTVYAPSQTPLDLLRRFDESLPFTFTLKNNDPLLESYTDLDRGTADGPAATLFHFDNATNREGEFFGATRQLLNDPSNHLTDAVLSVLPSVFDYMPEDPAASGKSLQIKDPLSGQIVWQCPVNKPSAPLRVDLRSLPEGRYNRTMDSIELKPFYLSNRPAAQQWGACSIYIGGQMQAPYLPAQCQSIDQSGVTRQRTFTLVLESRKTYWRYYIIDPAGKQDFGSYELIGTLRNPLARSIASEIEFLRSPDPATVDGRTAWVFEAQTPLPLLHSPSSMHLTLTLRPANGKRGERSLALPFANAGGLVRRNTSQPRSWSSEVFVYV